jgi:HSP20 family protein
MLTRFDPFQEFVGWRDAMNRLFAESFVYPTQERRGPTATSFPVDVLETEKGYQVEALLPGIKPENLEVSVQQNTLTVKGQLEPWVKPGQQGSWLVREIGTGAVERSLTFPRPIDVERIETSYQHGILSISVPFDEASRPRKISISRAQPDQITVEANTH